MRQHELFSVMTGIGMPYDIKLIFRRPINADALRPRRDAPHEKMLSAARTGAAGRRVCRGIGQIQPVSIKRVAIKIAAAAVAMLAAATRLRPRRAIARERSRGSSAGSNGLRRPRR
ncbi:hypothetical protein ACVIJ6_004835 [Bradyrhizobium sp. USDA 4369]